MRKKILFVTMLINCTQPLFATIVFDIGNVLLNVKIKKAIFKLAPDIASDAFKHKCSPWRIARVASRRLLYEYLNARRTAQTGLPLQNNSITDEKGKLLPDDLCDLLSGTIDCAALITKIENQSAPKGFDDRDKKLVITIISKSMSPEAMASIMEPAPGILELIDECKQAIDPQTNRPQELWILSNMSEENFTALAKKYPAVFAPFSKIFISGSLKICKPERGIYQRILDDNNNQSTLIFIDDQACNVQAAQTVGIDSIHHKNVFTTRKELVKRVQFQDRATVTSNRLFNGHTITIGICSALAAASIIAWKLLHRTRMV